MGRSPLLASVTAAIAIAGGLPIAASFADRSSERPRSQLRPALVANGPELVRSEVGSYCVSRETEPGEEVGSCADAPAPTRPPAPRLTVSRTDELTVRFRHARGLMDEVTGFTATLLRLGGRQGYAPVPGELEPTRAEDTKRRWRFVLPANLRRANALEIFATLESGDATYTAGLRRIPDPQAPLICPLGGGDAFDTARLVGLSVAEGEALAERHDCTIRISELDGEPQAGTGDYQTNRVNVAVADEQITRVDGVG